MTQRVTFWKRLIKQAHIAQVGRIKAAAKLPRQLLGQQWQQPLAINRPRRAALLKLHNVVAYLPAGLYLNDIHRAQRPAACIADELAQRA